VQIALFKAPVRTAQ